MNTLTSTDCSNKESTRLLTRLRKENIDLVFSRQYNIYSAGTVITIIGELDDDVGNVINSKIKGTEDTVQISEYLFWTYVEKPRTQK